MRRLVEPNKGDTIKADLVREIIAAIRENMPIAGLGLKAEQTSSGTVLSLQKLPSKSASVSGSAPRSFDMAPGSAGKLKLVRCYYQRSDKFIDRAEEPEFTPAAGNVCAVINNSGEVTAVMNAVYDPNHPELFPVRLYVIDASGNVICDCRGTQVVTHG